MKRILITGGTGFLGRHLGRRLAAIGHSVVLTGRNHHCLQQARQLTACDTLAMDVTNIESVRDAFTQVRPNVVIHAAASKFADFAERQPMEALDVNVLGSQNVARVAIDRQVSLVIGISTHQAAPPVGGTYGLTKALMERMFSGMEGKSATSFFCVRYGNVAWSTGSVFCLWEEMLRKDGIIKTTGPEMLRFLLTVDEAVDLMVTAMQNASDLRGKVLSRQMKAARMEDILKIWIADTGARFQRIEGRPGERTQEVLIGSEELPYTREWISQGVTHYVTSFNQPVEKPLSGIVSCITAERLSEREIRQLIAGRPTEETPAGEQVATRSVSAPAPRAVEPGETAMPPHPFQHALIMAAGRGNRMGALTQILPKAMSPYKDGTLISNSLRWLRESVDHVHITVGHKSQILAQYVVNLGVSSIFNTDGYSNSWWLHHTLMRYVDGPVLVLTCDNIVELRLDLLAEDYSKAGQPACMLVPVKPIPGVDGDFVHHQRGIVTMVNRTQRAESYCSGIQVLNPARIAAMTRPESDFYAIWSQLIAQGELRVSSVYPDRWFSVDTLDQLMQAA